MLPGLDGEEVLPQTKGIPVIVVSAKVDVDDKVDLLLGGAADYVTKPFEMKELLARIAVQLRSASVPGNHSVLTYDNIALDMDTHSVTVADCGVKLTRTEFAILKLLMQTPSRVFPKSQLLDCINEDTPDCTESSLKTHISHLRGKLREPGGRDYIESVWGIGFKMN
jgi:DNA-binding response OmpR family regulator